MKNETLKILGVMTGTSCDGIDMACIAINSQGWTPLWNSSAPYPASLKKRVLDFQRPASSHTSQAWLALHRDLGHWYGTTIQKKLGRHKGHPEVIANHGQTVAHFPAPTRQRRGHDKNTSRGPIFGQNFGTTLQLGDAARISTATGLTVVSHFRDGDMAAGGQGAPLAPLFHRMLAEKLNSKTSGIAIHNLGGISNLTYFGPKNLIVAFDTGPANIWIDLATEQATQGKQTFDSGGRLASLGTPDKKAIAQILKHPYFSMNPPKSTGRDQFSFEYFMKNTKSKGNDLVATATAVTIDSVVQTYKQWILKQGLPLQKIYLCGGGAKNLTLLKGIQAGLEEVTVSTFANLGLDTQAVEPMAFAVFGYLSLLGKPLGGKWTGAQSFGPPGQITPGQNWSKIMHKIVNF